MHGSIQNTSPATGQMSQIENEFERMDSESKDFRRKEGKEGEKKINKENTAIQAEVVIK